MGTGINPRTVGTPLVGTTSVLVVAANPTRVALTVFNPSSTITLAICPLDTAAVINGAGTITVSPGQGVELDGWTAGLNAVASGGSNNAITIYEFS